ncbi:hypothetical protein PVAND_009024 [Polypedilum vanderplanki]|uniref:Fibronectin type-III domain-containing protein n=1 Tax=Polypedilum vanderplanki TaxID=319348 RepID=A0A9J6CCI0_POLVA|nr:hypothetical protein PVAND_009024 [Polypedilum vanderplanki]
MSEVETKELDSIADVVSSVASTNDEFFDAVADDDDVNKISSENGKKENEEEDEEDILKKLEEAISESDVQTNNGDIQNNPVNSESLEGDELSHSDKEFLDLMNEKSEDELLKDLDQQNEIANEIEELVNSAKEQNDNEEESSDMLLLTIKDHETVSNQNENANVNETKIDEINNHTDNVEKNENLLFLCKEQSQDETTQNESSNEDSNIENEPIKLNDQQSTERIITDTSEITSIASDDENKQNDDVSVNENEQLKEEVIESTNEKTHSNDDGKMMIDENLNLEKNEDIEMLEDNLTNESHSKESELTSCDVKDDDKIVTETAEKNEFNEKLEKEEEEEERETLKTTEPEPIKLNFLTKFATSVGKISRAELEEIVLQKTTEALIYRTKYTEYRNKCEKQDEIIENLNTKIATLHKQYNDLDMIHKRIMKDLKERPDQPVAPVKITRAVGLQVYPPSSSNNNKNKMIGTATAVSSPQNAVKSTPLITTNNKRPGDALNETEAKKKRPTKMLTPLRPPLSEKAKANLGLEEASIEQTIVRNLKKNDLNNSTNPQITIRPVNNSPRPANGTLTKTTFNREKNMNSQSIDLTDEDDAPITNPPALVAIQRNNPMQSRTIKSPQMPIVRTPDMINRGLMGRTNFMIHPAPLPMPPAQTTLPGYKKIPPRPTIKINNVKNGIIVSWTVDSLSAEHEKIANYQIYAYEETRAQPTTENWKHVGDVKALLLPMAVTLTQFQEGQKYFFAVRAVDIYNRVGQFSQPKTWN